MPIVIKEKYQEQSNGGLVFITFLKPSHMEILEKISLFSINKKLKFTLRLK